MHVYEFIVIQSLVYFLRHNIFVNCTERVLVHFSGSKVWQNIAILGSYIQNSIPGTSRDHWNSELFTSQSTPVDKKFVIRNWYPDWDNGILSSL